MNPIIYSDFPDPDIIRVGDTYYMASTTMHYFPGCDILRSYDLVNWELLDQVYHRLEETENHRLEGQQHIYGQGMWAPCIRFHNNKFYVVFAANDTRKTYLFTADHAEGPWEKHIIKGFYHDSSLLFDDDGKVYIVYGQKTLYLTELELDLSAPKKGGLSRVIAVDEDRTDLGYEGSHIYKRNGKYYIFSCHILSYGTNRKSEVCLISDSLTKDFEVMCIIDDDMGYHNLGVAQGGMVDTPDGNWYAFMFHDRGALGRAPMLMPMHFENDIPAIGDKGKVPQTVTVVSTRPDYGYCSINGDDDFIYHQDDKGEIHLKSFWQFNHVPNNDLWSVTERNGAYRMRSGKICRTVMEAYNTLTQRMLGPDCAAQITVDGSEMNNGDYAGLCAFQGCYGMIALTKENDSFYLVMIGKQAKNETIFGDFDYEIPGTEYSRVQVSSSIVNLRLEADFANMVDEAKFYYKQEGEWKALGITQKLYFKMDHFTGCRFGLCYYSTKQKGGVADFMSFRFFNNKNREVK